LINSAQPGWLVGSGMPVTRRWWTTWRNGVFIRKRNVWDALEPAWLISWYESH